MFPHAVHISDDTLPVVAMYGDTLPVVAMYGDTLPVVAMYDDTLPVVAMYGDTLPVVAMYGDTLPVVAMYGSCVGCSIAHIKANTGLQYIILITMIFCPVGWSAYNKRRKLFDPTLKLNAASCMANKNQIVYSMAIERSVANTA